MGVVTHDRGLGSAYERYCFYQLLFSWAERFGITSALEGPIDGMAGVFGVHTAGLAQRGIEVTSLVPSEAHREAALGIYRAVGAPRANVAVAGESHLRSLSPCDLVVSYHALPFVEDWRAYLGELARLAKKLLVVAVCNPDTWGYSLRRAILGLHARKIPAVPESWQASVVAPRLWELGRVRDHVYFDCPWWPDMQPVAGQTVGDTARRVFSAKAVDPSPTVEDREAKLASRFVFGQDRWPYFGGPGWVDELLPALLRHPGFDGAPRWLTRRTAHIQAFVVDMRPRTAQVRLARARAEGAPAE